MHLGPLKWRLLKEPVDELLVRDKKHQLERAESLDKKLGMRRNLQTFFSVSTVKKKRRKRGRSSHSLPADV